MMNDQEKKEGSEMANGQAISGQAIGADDKALLDDALRQSKEFLSKSLKEDEFRRRRRRWVIGLTITGGMTMTVFLVWILSGVMTTAPAGGDGQTNSVDQANVQPPAIDMNKKVTPQEMEMAEEIAAEGWQLWQKRNWADAEKKFYAAVAMDPGNSNLWNGLGWARFNGGKWKEGLEAFEQAIKLSPNHPAALNGAGQASLVLNRLADAEKYLNEAASQNASAAWYGLARLYLLQEKYAEAQKWAQKLVDDQPANTMYKKMLEAAKVGKVDDELMGMIELPKQQPAAKQEQSKEAARGWQLFVQGKYRPAVAWFKRALETNPNELSAINGLGFCLLNQGNVSEAKPLFEKYLEMEPDAAGPLNGLARCLKAEGDVDGAIRVWEKMYKLYPGPNAAAAGLAMTYLDRKEYEKAVKYFEVLVDYEPDNQEYVEGLEQVRKNLNQN